MPNFVFQFPKISVRVQTQKCMLARTQSRILVWDKDLVMTDFGKLLIYFGLALVVAGLLLTLFGRLNLPLGKLPGDIVYRGKHTTFYFPLATSVLLSVVLSLLLYAVGRWKK
jgi:hypothetical protein